MAGKESPMKPRDKMHQHDYMAGMKDQWHGLTDRFKGRGKDAGGALKGNRKMQAEGKADVAKGRMWHLLGDMKESMSHRLHRH
jgi:uncharacterized protein YjbJ (UPF0337 family)